MKVFAVGDLHLGHAVRKPMDVFGPQWKDHAQQIAGNWQERVSDQDLVLVPGDVSWAMRLEEAEEDLLWLDRLPGRKVLLKGNHDYWWPSITRLRNHLRGTSLFALQYDSLTIEGVSVSGTRLWTMPGLEIPYEDPLAIPSGEAAGPASSDPGGSGMTRAEKIFRRELERLKLSLDSIEPGAYLRTVMTHFPPTDETGKDTTLTKLLESYRADICVFGHLHNLGLPPGKTWDFLKSGVRYVLVSCDSVGFAPYLLAEVPTAAP